MGFENQPATPGPGGAVARPSTEWPFQRFSWTYHDADTGDTVSYRVIPVIRDSGDNLQLVQAQASEWSPERTLGAGMSRVVGARMLQLMRITWLSVTVSATRSTPRHS